MHTAVIGGGAAGFFLAICLKERMPEMEVTIFERGRRVLSKVAMSGGGRCNCTNTFEDVADLSHVYPRGHRLLRRLFHDFDHHSTWQWFTSHGVPLMAQPDHCVFPVAQDARAVTDCFLHEARRHGITVRTGHAIGSLNELQGFDFVAVTTGGSLHADALQWLRQAGHETVPPVPSLFSLSVADTSLRTLMGTVVEDASVQIAGSKFAASGPLLLTHWGVSGPAVLHLSSHAARHLHDADYHVPLSISWLSADERSVRQQLAAMNLHHPQKLLSACPFPALTQRLWNHLLHRSLGNQDHRRWAELSQKDLNRLANTLLNDTYTTAGRAPFHDELVTCGGISLKSVNASTMESRVVPRLYFAGEVLDVDGVTGGFNFQACWTTAYVAARHLAQQAEQTMKPT